MSIKTSPAADEEYLKKIDQDLLWYRACQRSVRRGDLKVSALDAMVKLYGPQVIVTDGSVSLNGMDLDEACTEIVKKTPDLWAAPADQKDPVLEAEEAAKALALSGSVSGHGALYRMWESRFGEVEATRRYNAWKAEQGVEPGKPSALNGAVDHAKKIDEKNPFVRLRVNGVVVKAVADEIAEHTRLHGFAATKKLADEAGVNLSGLPLRKTA